jgi:hypothetical protein
MALVELPEDQSKTLGNPQITLTPAGDVDEVEVDLEAVAVAVEVSAVVQVALEVEVANDSASRDE